MHSKHVSQNTYYSVAVSGIHSNAGVDDLSSGKALLEQAGISVPHLLGVKCLAPIRCEKKLYTGNW